VRYRMHRPVSVTQSRVVWIVRGTDGGLPDVHRHPLLRLHQYRVPPAAGPRRRGRAAGVGPVRGPERGGCRHPAAGPAPAVAAPGAAPGGGRGDRCRAAPALAGLTRCGPTSSRLVIHRTTIDGGRRLAIDSALIVREPSRLG